MSLFLHQVCRNVSLHRCLSNGCSAVNGCRQIERQWMGAVRMRVSGCSAVNGCRQIERQWMGAVRMSQWMRCSEWVPSEWVNGCSAVNGCRQNGSQGMRCSEWVPSEWESMDALRRMGAVRMSQWMLWLILTAPIHCRASIDSFWRHPLTLILTAPIHCSASIDSFWRHPFTAMDALQWMGAVRMGVNGCAAPNGCRQNKSLIKTSHHSSPSVNIWRRQNLKLIHQDGFIERLMQYYISLNLMKKQTHLNRWWIFIFGWTIPLICSKLTVKTFIVSQKILVSNKCSSFELFVNPEKIKHISFHKNIVQHDYFQHL